ncbi:hypothetical protein EZV62_013555 [Acer yangbiense]|uniref:Gnk2-homologous domain-containing protein n=1 Tax=Acer yangbiense TaxID=1000413 RepID=A0A5C7I195_9ROSI|nr:hypothetical protein EZV62_013555 [Acer yangbiense]
MRIFEWLPQSAALQPQNPARKAREVSGPEFSPPQPNNQIQDFPVLIEFVQRLSNGFDGYFQDLILKAKVFSIFELLLCDFTCSKRVREHVSLAIEALVNFNRNVFVGLVLMGPTIQALINMNSSCSIRVLCSLINLIRSPLIDEIHSKGQIPEIITFLSFNDLSIQVAAMDCICQIAYFGRREVIEEMIKQGVIDKLMELQRSINTTDQNPDDDSPFSSWVSRFAVQVEVGEGLSSREKMEIKLEILKRVKEASVSEAETATIVAEVFNTTLENCNSCICNATDMLVKECKGNKTAIIWFDRCTVRYSNRSFYSTLDTYPAHAQYTIHAYDQEEVFAKILNRTIKKTIAMLSASNYGIQNATVFNNKKLYTLVQCLPDLSTEDCRACLNIVVYGNVVRGVEPSGLLHSIPFPLGGSVLNPSCNIRFEIYPFYGDPIPTYGAPESICPSQGRDPEETRSSSEILSPCKSYFSTFSEVN